MPSSTRPLAPAPTTTSPQRMPIVPIRIGISRAPTAMPPMTALSIAPKTRDITASGAIRCRIVYALTSTTEFASPSMIMTATALATLGHAATRSSGAAQKSTPMPKLRARRPRWASSERDEPADEPADPERRVQEAETGVAEPEQAEARSRRRRRARRLPRRSARSRDRPGAAGRASRGSRGSRPTPPCRKPPLGVRRLGGGRRRLPLPRGRPDAEHERGRPDERDPVEDVDRRQARDGEQQARQRRPGEEADALDRRRRDVRRGELARALGQIGDQRGLSRPERGAAERGDDCKRIDASDGRRTRSAPRPRTRALHGSRPTRPSRAAAGNGRRASRQTA